MEALEGAYDVEAVSSPSSVTHLTFTRKVASEEDDGGHRRSTFPVGTRAQDMRRREGNDGSMTPPGTRSSERWRLSWWALGVAALLAAACFAAYWGWLGWDQTYQLDPVTGAASGPYEPWQVVGCALTLVLVAMVAGLARQAAVAMVVMPCAFTIAWSMPARATDESGLWAVGAIMILVGMTAGVAVVAPLLSLLGSRLLIGRAG